MSTTDLKVTIEKDGTEFTPIDIVLTWEDDEVQDWDFQTTSDEETYKQIVADLTTKMGNDAATTYVNNFIDQKIDEAETPSEAHEPAKVDD